jgi:AcrR family transcriptional regulator
MADDRRGEIVAAARRLLAEQGPHALSVRHVAAAAGIGASTLRHYFPTQAALRGAVAEELLRAQVADLRIGDSSVPAVDRLSECLDQFLPPDDERVPELAGWLSAYAAAAGPDPAPESQRVLGMIVREGRARVDSWLTVLDAEGSLRGDLDLDQARRLLLATLDGVCLGLLAPEPDGGLADGRALLRHVVSGLVRPHPRHGE